MNKNINFTKITAQGNNYIYVDNRDLSLQDIDLTSLAIAVSDIRFGIGSDGLVVINPDVEADCFMRIFNSDGSEAKMCGNALRSLAYLLAQDMGKVEISINSLSGVKQAKVDVEQACVRVEMGQPKLVRNFFSPSLNGNVIDIGNLHLIVNNKEANLTRAEFLKLAEDLQKTRDFPDGINIELIDVVSPKRVEAIVYERGSGLTFACGSGASALFWDCYQASLVDSSIIVGLDGGDLKVFQSNNNVNLEGEVRIVCQGTFKWSL